MSQRLEFTHNSFANQQRFNPLSLTGEPPKFLQVRIRIDLALRCWTCRAGAAGAAKYLQFFAGTFPVEIARTDEVRAQSYCLTQAARKIKAKYPDAQISTIEFNPENVEAPISRLALGGQNRWVV